VNLSRSNLNKRKRRVVPAPGVYSDFGFGRAPLGFTLMEMLLALAISAIVLAGIGGVFYSAMRLRERTMAALDESAPLYRALGFLRRDLKGALPPGGMMAGDFKIGALNSGAGQAVGIQFTTTTGVLKDELPWGDVQEITYELRDPVVRTNGAGKDLIRTISRNLLSTTALDYNEQWLLGNVESLEFNGFDGMNWRELWDTSITETNLPNAVRMRIQLVADDTIDVRNRQPIELWVPLVIQSRTNQVQQASGGGG
jgi:type II secretion system protein J